MFRPLSRGQLIFDIVAPLVILTLLIVPYSFLTENVFALVGMCAALTFWRLNAGLSLGIAWATALLQMALGLDPDPSNLAILVVLYATGAYGNRLVKWLGLASVFLGAASIALYLNLIPFLLYGGNVMTTGDVTRSVITTFLGFVALFALSWTLGVLTKTFSTAQESRRAQTVAEMEQERALRDVVVEQERTRIARDMHDVVAHSLAVVIAQADGARYARHADPDAVDGALSTISSTARDALGDVRVLLGQLRHGQAAGPQPVLDDLPRMLDQVRAAGLTIEFTDRGGPGQLGTNQQIALYRIIQEALTNALRHGDTERHVEVSLGWFPDRVVAHVANAMRDTEVPELRPGHGLAGMRERAALIGGRAEIVSADGVFHVNAWVPRPALQTDRTLAVPAENAAQPEPSLRPESTVPPGPAARPEPTVRPEPTGPTDPTVRPEPAAPVQAGVLPPAPSESRS